MNATPAKDFLLNDNRVSQKAIAELMFKDSDGQPTKGATVQLNMKLKGNRPWTIKDEEAALKALKKLGVDLRSL